MAAPSHARPSAAVVLESPRVRSGVVIGCVAAVAALGFALRVPGALHNAFWHDEVYSARVIVAHSPVAAVQRVEQTESSPPGWYLLGWLLHHVGVSVTDVRILSALAGALTAALVVLLALRFMALWAAAFVGLTTAVGYEYVYQGEQLRCYALLVLVAVATVIALLRAAEQPTIARLAQVAVCVAVGSYTHYFFAFVVIAGLVWVATSTAGIVRRRLGAGMLIGLAAVLPWIPSFIDQHNRASYRFGIGQFRPGLVLASYWKMVFPSLPSGGLLRIAAVGGLLAAIGAGAVLLSRQGIEGRLCAIMATVPVVVSACLWRGGEPIFNVRNVLEAGPFAAICVGVVLMRLGRYAGPAVAALLVVLLLPGVVRADINRNPIPFDAIARALRSEGWTSSDATVTPAGMNWTVPLRWYSPDTASARPAGGGQVCPALFTITAAHRFPESRVVGDPAGASIAHAVAGRYLILRIPPGIQIRTLPRGSRAVNMQCKVSGLPQAVRDRLRH